MTGPLISVVVPFWNRRAYLATAISSIVSTRYARLEILAVDDGSTDGAAEVAGALRDQGAPVRILSHPGNGHRGIAATRNLGLTEARGELIAFLDSDDAFLPWRFDVCVPHLLRNDRLIATYEPVRTAGSAAFDDLLAQGHDLAEASTLLPPTGVFEPDRLLDALLGGANLWWLMPGVLLRREAVEAIGLFETSLPVAEDTNYWVRLAASSRVACAQDGRAVALVRLHDDQSWSAVRGSQYHLLFLKALKTCLCRVPHGARRRIRDYLSWHFHDALQRYANSGQTDEARRLVRGAIRVEPALLSQRRTLSALYRLLLRR